MTANKIEHVESFRYVTKVIRDARPEAISHIDRDHVVEERRSRGPKISARRVLR